MSDSKVETMYVDAKEVEEKLDLPSEPIQVVMVGRNVGFKVIDE